jgi:hypothetical protein
MAQQKQKGVVFRVHEKDYRGKMLYSFKFDGGDENEWFRLGEDRHEGVIEEGNTVGVYFTIDRRDNRQVEKAVLLEKGDPAPARSSNRSTGGRKPSGGGQSARDKYWEDKDAYDKEVREPAIRYQAARRDAIDVVKMLLDNEAVKLPAKTKVNERRDAIEGLVDVYTAQLYLDVMEQGAVKRAGDELRTPDSVDDFDETGDDGFEDPSEGAGDEW